MKFIISLLVCLTFAVTAKAYLFNPSAAGGGTWGSITGTLSSQTDLNSALGGKVSAAGTTPLTGNWDVGGNKITNLGAPTATSDAATKNYVDTTSFTGEYYVSTACAGNSTTITNTTFTTYSNSSTLTFTPIHSGDYRVYFTGMFSMDNASDAAISRIAATVGAPTLITENTSQLNVNVAGGFNVTSTTESVFTLNSGTSYSFVVQGKTSAALGNNLLLCGFGTSHIIAVRIK